MDSEINEQPQCASCGIYAAGRPCPNTCPVIEAEGVACEPVCKTCGGSGMTPGWVPSYYDPDNSGLAEPAEPCPDCNGKHLQS